MRLLRDGRGTIYLLLADAGEECHLRSLETGERRTFPCSDLEPVEAVDALQEIAAEPAEIQPAITAIGDDRAVGLLLELVDRGPIPVMDLLDRFDICESDLHGLVTELRAAQLLEPATVHGERGYAATDRTRVSIEGDQ